MAPKAARIVRTKRISERRRTRRARLKRRGRGSTGMGEKMMGAAGVSGCRRGAGAASGRGESCGRFSETGCDGLRRRRLNAVNRPPRRSGLAAVVSLAISAESRRVSSRGSLGEVPEPSSGPLGSEEFCVMRLD